VRVAAVLAICLAASVAHADPRADIAKKISAAMGSYDLMDYDAAKLALAQAIEAGTAAKLDNDPVMARAYVDLGVVLFAAGDEAGAKKSFALAVKIDPKIRIEPGYRSKENEKALDDMRGGGGAVAAACAPGLQHVIIESAKAGAALPIEATVGADVQAKRVSVLYRAEGATDFTEVKLASKDGCKYTGSIPASALHGSLVHYYVAAYGDAPKPLAEIGSSSAPNIIELTAGGGGDKENPLPTEQPTNNEVDKGVEVTPGQHALSIGVAVGGGFGFIRGADTTENMNPIDSAGFGHSVVIAPEVSYRLSPQLALGVVGRLALPYDANIAGHSAIGPAGLVRARFTPDSPPIDGLSYMAEAGAGITRSTLTISGAMPSQGNIDIVATGPLLLGGGVSYARPLSSSFTFVADASLLLGVAVVDKIGLATMNTGATLDLSIGVAFGL
jgi:hypothetical protein